MNSDVEADETLRLLSSNGSFREERPSRLSNPVKIVGAVALLALCSLVAFSGQSLFSPGSSGLKGTTPMDFAVLKKGTIGNKSSSGFQASFTTSGAVPHYPEVALTPEQSIEEKV